MGLICRSSRILSIVVLAIVAVGFAALGHSVPIDHASATADISIVAIDTNISGNTATPCDANGNPNLDYPCNNSTVLGPIDTCASIAVGDTIQIDIVGSNIPAGAGNGTNASFAGAGQSDMTLNWSPNGLGTSPIAVMAKNTTVALIHQGIDGNANGSFNGVGANANGESGHWAWSDVDVNPDLVGEGGPGIAIRLSIKGVSAGTANLSLGLNLLSQPTWTDINGNEYSVGTYQSATIAVGQACPTATADLVTTAATVSSPATATAGTAFNVVAGGTVKNNGPATSATADATVTLAMPPDCTAAGGEQRTITGLTLNVGVPVTLPDQTFSVTCTTPSFHAFNSTVAVIFGSNQMTSTTSTTAVLGTADIALQSVTLTATAAATPTPMAGMVFILTAHLSVSNSGPFGPAPVQGSATLTVPSNCEVVTILTADPMSFSALIAVGTQTVDVSWQMRCNTPGDHALSVSASLTASDQHVTDTSGTGNNSGSGNLTITAKVGVCGDDPDPAGEPLVNPSPELLLLISKLTSSGTPVADNLKYQVLCTHDMQLRDQNNTPADYCQVNPVAELPCSLSLNMSIDLPGGAPANSFRLNPIGVGFVAGEFDWANDTEVVNGSTAGAGSYSILTDAGSLQNVGISCTLTPNFPLREGFEGGIKGNVPETNSTADLLNPNLWPNDLNAEKALVESSFETSPGQSGVTLWSRVAIDLQTGGGLSIPMNVLIWKVTNPGFQAITGALWVIVPFPGDAVNPDPPGTIGGNPDADDPPAPPSPYTYCAPNKVSLNFFGMAGDTVYLSCHQTGNPLSWTLIDPDATNVTGDEGPRSDTSPCVLPTPDMDGDGVPDSVDNCPMIANSNQANFNGDAQGDVCGDADGDGFLDDLEMWLGVNPSQACPTTGAPPANSGRNDEAVDSTPYDNDDNRLVTGSDLLTYAPSWGAIAPDPRYNKRLDVDRNGRINGNDLLAFAPYFNKPPCVP